MAFPTCPHGRRRGSISVRSKIDAEFLFYIFYLRARKSYKKIKEWSMLLKSQNAVQLQSMDINHYPLDPPT